MAIFKLNWNGFLDDLLGIITWTIIALAASACAVSLCIGSDDQHCSTFDIWAAMAAVSSSFLVFQLLVLFFYHLVVKWIVVQRDCETGAISV
jgi:hypothetical protein